MLSCRFAELIAALIMNRGNISKENALVSEGWAAGAPVTDAMRPIPGRKGLHWPGRGLCPDALDM